MNNFYRLHRLCFAFALLINAPAYLAAQGIKKFVDQQRYQATPILLANSFLTANQYRER
jgi:hypothetical protein